MPRALAGLRLQCLQLGATVWRRGAALDKAWFLESIAADGSHVTQAIRQLPFRVGRDAGSDLAVDARGLSRLHAVIDEEMARIATEQGAGRMESGRFVDARRLFETLSTAPTFEEFLTLSAYELLG